MVTSHILQDKNIKKLVKNGNIIEDFVSKNDTGRFTSGGKAQQGLEPNQRPDTLIDNSISKKEVNVNENKNILNSDNQEKKVSDINKETAFSKEPLEVGGVEYGLGQALKDLMQNFKNLKHINPKTLEGKTAREKYNSGVNILIDNVWDGIFNLGESLYIFIKSCLKVVSLAKRYCCKVSQLANDFLEVGRSMFH